MRKHCHDILDQIPERGLEDVATSLAEFLHYYSGNGEGTGSRSGGGTGNVLGLPVIHGSIHAKDLIDWIGQRDAGCAEYLAPALREYLETGRNIPE